MFPAAYELFGRWVPSAERARALARLLSGVPVGTVVGLLGSAWLVQRYGWPAAFYVFGSAGLVWSRYWFQDVRNDSASDARLDPDERALLSAECVTPASAPTKRRAGGCCARR